MNRPTKRTAFAVTVLSTTGLWAIVGLSRGAVQNAPTKSVRAETATGRIVRAANAFLATLSPEQRKRELYAFTDEAQRARWSNFPTGFVPRGGLSLQELRPAQRTAAMALVSTALSKRGYEKCLQIMEGDEVLKANEGARDASMFGKDLYYISILGTPSTTNLWTLLFGGHHLAINLTVAGERGILTPTLTGAQPAQFTVNGKTVRPLAEESDRGLALLNALDEGPRKQAVLNYRVSDLVLGPGQDGRTIVPEGLKASAMNPEQRALLLSAIEAWAGIVNEGEAKTRMKEIEAGLSETWFAWSGPTTGQAGQNIAAYYRIQGPKLVIEYAPQRMGGNPALHVHTIYCDPTNDYGRAR